MGNTTIFLHFGKLEVIFENGVKLTIISNAYPYEKKINEQCEIKEYNNDLWLKVGEKIEQNNDWIERFKELNADSFNEGDVEKSLKNFFTKIKERYRVTEITGYDIPLRQSGVNTWSVDERNAVSIALYDGDDYKLNGEGLRIFDRQAIRITENADYDIMVSEGYQIRLSHIDLTKNFISQFGEKQNEARINFQGYTFFGNILIIRDKEPAAYLPFLVFPSKVEPLDAERILDELIENMEEIIKSSPTHIPLEPRGWIEKSPLHTLILINNMFSETRKGRVSLGKTLSAIASSPDKRLLNEKIKKSSYEVTSVDDDSIMEAITTGGLKSGSQTYHHFKLENNHYLFVNLIDEVSHISYDTPPNRFVKYFLEFLLNTINGCIENIRERHAESIPLLEDFKESLIKNTLYYQKRYITPFLNLDWMNEVSRITYLPPPSQKLLKDPFYSNIFFDYIDLISNIKIVDEELEKYLHNPITWMPELYELWCKLKLKKIAEEKGIQFGYQSSYTKKSKSWISYSLSLCPDFSLTKGKHLIHLDAKYRTDFVEEWKDKKEKEIKEKEIEEKRGTFKLGDLYKMHTYREAILRKEDKKKPLWVIALYPGTKVALYSESLTSIELDVKDVKNDKIIEKDFFSSGGVGALPFTPSLLDDEKYKSWLNNLFDLLLEVKMCRLFGLIANKEVDIRFSMLEARNKFKEQGRTNYHGWGIGWYEKGRAKIEKYGESAFTSNRFDNLVKELTSRIFIAHVRLASSGSRADKNAHPFLYKNWLFAHNGTINCDKMLRKLLIEPYSKNFTSEPIDSEIYFRFIIQNIEKEGDIIQGIKNAVKIVVPGASGANFILSDGESIYGFKYGKELYFLSRDPNSLSSTSKVTGALIESKRLLDEKAVIIASEKLTDERWQEVKEGELIIVNSKLEIRREVLL